MARSNLQIAVGSYAGTGAGQDITTVGFEPTVVIIKGGSTGSVIRTRLNRGDTTLFLGQASVSFTNGIQYFSSLGFHLGTSSNVNTNGVTYTYIAFRGTAAQQFFRTYRYYGDGTTPRTISTLGLSFTPDIAFAITDTGAGKVFRTLDMTALLSARFDANALASAGLRDFVSGGIIVGSSTIVNGSGTEYYGFGMKKATGVIACGKYTGDGNVTKAITGLGFQPSAVMVKRDGASAGRLFTTVQAGGNSLSMANEATQTNCITSLDTDGFTVANDASINSSGDTYYWIAIQAGNFNVPLSRNSA